jgi:hypothetical protein
VLEEPSDEPSDQLSEEVTLAEETTDTAEANDLREDFEEEQPEVITTEDAALEEGDIVEDFAMDGDDAAEPQEEEIAEVPIEEVPAEELPQDLPEFGEDVEETAVLPESVEEVVIEEVSEVPELAIAVEDIVEQPEFEGTLPEATSEEAIAESEVGEAVEVVAIEELPIQDELVDDVIIDTHPSDAITNDQEVAFELPENLEFTDVEEGSDAEVGPVDVPVTDVPIPIDDNPEEQEEEPAAEESVPVTDDIESYEREEEEPVVEEREVSEAGVPAQELLEDIEEPVVSEIVEDTTTEVSVPEDPTIEESQHDVDIAEESPMEILEEQPVDVPIVEEETFDDIPEYLPLPPEVDTSLNVFDDFDEEPVELTPELANGEQEEAPILDDPFADDNVSDQLDTPHDRDIEEEDEAAQADSEIQDDMLDPEMVESIIEPPFDDEEFAPSVIEVPQEETEKIDASDPYGSAAEELDGEEQGSSPEASENEMAVDDMGFSLDLSQNADFIPSEIGEAEPASNPFEENPLGDDYIESQQLEREMAVDDMGIPFDLSQNVDVYEDTVDAPVPYQEDDSAQESDASLPAVVDTPQTPMSPVFVHQHVESYTRLLHDADDEAIERSIQDDFSAQEPVFADFDEGLLSIILC